MSNQTNHKNHQDFLTSPLGKKFINILMVNGKKSTAERIFLESLVLIQSTLKQNSVKTVSLSINNVKPVVEIRSVRMRGANYQVPIPLTESRKISLAIKWIVATAKKKQGSSMKIKLKDELIAASQNHGESVKKKLTIHKLANANRAFAHYRWF